MIDLVRQLLSMRIVRYFFASACALCVDMSVFLLLLQTALFSGVSAAISFLMGTVVHWVILSRRVFEEHTARPGEGRAKQKALYLCSTFAGLAITTGIVTLGDLTGGNVIYFKGVAIVVSFFSIYFVRKHFVFRAGNSA